MDSKTSHNRPDIAQQEFVTLAQLSERSLKTKHTSNPANLGLGIKMRDFSVRIFHLIWLWLAKPRPYDRVV